jgi:predicted Fe-Mo cluster-binding NifX family protein
MKIAFSTSGVSLYSPMDSRFGRAANFLVYDLDMDSLAVIDNQQNLNSAQGAGIQSAEKVARAGVGAVVTGHCGPKAFRVLTAAAVKVYITDAPTVSAALAQYRAGELSPAGSADVEGHG